jgi:PAS domain S-box-containing protein
MLSVNSGPLQQTTKRRQRNAEISRSILRISSQLAACKSEDIEKTIQSALTEVSEIECAEQAGWFLLSELGMLLEVFHSTCSPSSLCSAFRDGLHGLPWCLTRLAAGQAIAIDSLDDMLPEAEIDRQFLRASGVQSVAFLPLTSVTSGRTMLILSSISTEIEWSNSIVEQYTLLGNLFSNAYQRRLAQNEFQASEKCFQQLFTTSASAMALLNNAGQFVSTNNAFRDILGYSKDEFQKMKCEDITNSTHPNDKPGLPKYLSGLAVASHQFERTLIRKDKSLLPARIKAALIELPCQEALSLVSIEDLTQQRNRDTELRRRQVEISFLASQLIQSQEKERKRLSRELHDDIGQRLSLVASEVALLASQQFAAT